MAFKKILVALDGSEQSEQVLGSVAELASSFGSELTLLAVTDDDGSMAGTDDERPAAEYLKTRARQLQQQGLSASSATEHGEPAETIIAVAERESCDLIAMATHRSSTIARWVAGSVTDDVLKQTKLPVLAINPESGGAVGTDAGKITSVIVPLDGSELAEQSVPVATEIAKACGAEMLFLQAVHLPSYAVSGPGAENYGSDFGVGGKRDLVREYLHSFVRKAEEAGLKARSHAALGNAAARIVEDSKEIPGSLIVISSHGRSGFKRMVLGSVADELVRDSHHPVLVLKHGK